MSDSAFIRALLFGDPDGLPVLLRALPRACACGLVGAGIRPRQHAVLRQLADEHKLPLLIQPKASSPEYNDFSERVRSLVPDLILTHSYSMRLAPDILAIPKYGAVNVHGGLLPQYRGCNPIQWALLNRELETGVTMHHMTSEVDAGDIIAQRRVPILFTDTWRDVLARVTEATDTLLSEELGQLLSGVSARQPQDETRARRYPRRDPEDGRIDWRWSVLHIYNLIRALVRPHPGAFSGDGPDRIVLDEYLTIPQVAAMKYGPAGGQRLAAGSVRLSLPGADDLPHLLGWLADHQGLRLGGPDSPPPAAPPHSDLAANQQGNDLVIFAIHPLGGGLLGAGRLYDIDYTQGHAQVGVRLGATRPETAESDAEAIRLLVDFAFKDLLLHSLSARIPASDLAALRMYERAGFTWAPLSGEETRTNDGPADLVRLRRVRVEHAAV